MHNRTNKTDKNFIYGYLSSTNGEAGKGNIPDFELKIVWKSNYDLAAPFLEILHLAEKHGSKPIEAFMKEHFPLNLEVLQLNLQEVEEFWVVNCFQFSPRCAPLFGMQLAAEVNSGSEIQEGELTNLLERRGPGSYYQSIQQKGRERVQPGWSGSLIVCEKGLLKCSSVARPSTTDIKSFFHAR